MGTLALKVEPLSHAGPGEDVVASLRPHAKAFRLKQVAKFLESNIGI